MCPPFGWEEMCSHRSRRAWALMLASLGYPTARLDLPSTGNSGGVPSDPNRLDAWTGVASGLIKLSTVSRTGKAVTLAGVRAGGWFGEGTILKDEPRQYDLVALRDTGMALMNRSTFLWLFENSVAFNRFLVRQFNERLGQFIALVEYDRMLDAPGRLARSIGWLFNPVLYRDLGMHLEISQEELGLLSGMSRQIANKSLKLLESKGLLRIEHRGVTVLDLARLSRYGA